MTDDFNKPNIVLPVAASYNQRGNAGMATGLDVARDQRQVNSYHEVVSNPVTGGRTAYLRKRPGLRAADTFSLDAVSSNALLMIAGPDGSSWVIYRESSTADIKAANTTYKKRSIITLNTSTDYSPRYVDKTLISGTEYVVVSTTKSVTSKTPVQDVYYTNEISASWTHISAAAFTGLNHVGKMEHLDGYAFQMTMDGKIYNSDLNNLQSWPLTNFITKQIEQDTPAGLAKLKNMIIAFSFGSAEVFVNGGNTVGSPLVRRPELQFSVGLDSRFFSRANDFKRHYYAVAYGKLFFLGSESEGSGYEIATANVRNTNVGLYVFDGQSCQKVSSPIIDKILSDNTGSATPSHVTTVNVLGQVGIGIELGVDTGDGLVFFPMANEWHEWNSSVAGLINDGNSFAGSSPGTVMMAFRMDASSKWWDETTASVYPFDMIHQFKLPKNSNNREAMAWAGVVADSISASASTTANGNANLYISFSDNDYQSFGTPRVIDLTQRKKQVYRCGSYEDRVVRLVHSGNAECRIQAFIAKTM